MESKKKYIIFGKEQDVIKEGHFELEKSNNRTINSNTFSLNGLTNAVMLCDVSYKVLDLLLERYSHTEFDRYEIDDWFDYKLDELISESGVREEELLEIANELKINGILEFDENYWRII